MLLKQQIVEIMLIQFKIRESQQLSKNQIMLDRQDIIEDRMKKFRRAITKFMEDQVRTIKEKSQEEQEYEHNKIIRENHEYEEVAYQKKFKGVEVQLKIMKSRKINDMRMSKMKLRFEMIEKIQQDANDKLVEALSSPQKYKEMLKKLIIQGMIKMLEEKIEVQCLKKDFAIVKEAALQCEKDFADMCVISSKLVINENRPLPDSELGGIVLTSYHGKIVCNNTLRVRLEYAIQMFLPNVRVMLFGPNQ